MVWGYNVLNWRVPPYGYTEFTTRYQPTFCQACLYHDVGIQLEVRMVSAIGHLRTTTTLSESAQCSPADRIRHVSWIDTAGKLTFPVVCLSASLSRFAKSFVIMTLLGAIVSSSPPVSLPCHRYTYSRSCPLLTRPLDSATAARYIGECSSTTIT